MRVKYNANSKLQKAIPSTIKVDGHTLTLSKVSKTGTKQHPIRVKYSYGRCNQNFNYLDINSKNPTVSYCLSNLFKSIDDLESFVDTLTTEGYKITYSTCDVRYPYVFNKDINTILESETSQKLS